MRVLYRFYVYEPNVVIRSLGLADYPDYSDDASDTDTDVDFPLVEEFV